MENLLLYVIAGLCLVLLVVIIVLISQVSNLKKEVWENAQQTATSTQTMQSNLQNSITQSVNQTVSMGYAQMNQAFDSKLSNSFNSINQGLGQLQKGIGEMAGMASDVEDLRKVLSNVKARGMIGEFQLGRIFDEILTPSQYETNVETIPGTNKRVEYAV
ncbi:MAG: DNA recombination protein RmuC, partial [Bacillota bacterium]|nr:DNA recombination protein RmuC [Bacillota bacterium]